MYDNFTTYIVFYNKFLNISIKDKKLIKLESIAVKINKNTKTFINYLELLSKKYLVLAIKI